MSPPQGNTDPVDVTLRGGRHCGRRPGIRPHRSNLMDDEITMVDGIPVTSLARTLIDLSSVVGPRELERALAVAERAKATVRNEVRLLLDRYAGRPGTGRLRQLLESSAAPLLTRSDAEERLLALIREGGLPEPEMNIMVHGYEVDFFWRKARLIAEVDGYAYHGSARAFVRDRQRDSTLAAAGIQVMRISWHQLTKQAAKTLVQLAQALVRAGL
jgi:very-short-patch-repair endonuclease